MESEISQLPEWMQRKIRVDDDGCWIWLGRPNPKGYGTTTIGTRSVTIHRAVYEFLVGRPEAGRHLHHSCHRPICCNPRHLAPLTRVEHARAHGKLAETCKYGHPWTPENSYIRPDNGRRACRACKAAKQRARMARATPERRAAVTARITERRRERRLARYGTVDRRRKPSSIEET